MRTVKHSRTWLTPAIALMMALAVAAPSQAASITQLGFVLDGSGSVSTANYNLLRTGLSNALNALPVDGSVEISIVAYGSGSSTVTAPTLLTAATLPTIQTQILNHAKVGGGTDTAGAISATANLITGSSLFALTNNAIINLATDGVPNSQSAAVAAAQAAFAAGIDALSIEAIGSGVSSASALNNMAAIAFPTPVTILAVNSTNIPNPMGGSFVVPVSDFTVFADVIESQVIASVTPVPEPSLLGLLGLGFVGRLAMRRRRQA